MLLPQPHHAGVLPYGFMAESSPLPTLSDIMARVHILTIPMRVTFRGVSRRETALICGPHGWGEFAPFTEYSDEEAATWLASALEAAWLPPVATVREQVPVNATLPAVPAEQVPAVLKNYAGAVNELKIKVAERSQSLADDIARVSSARAALPHARLKVDANGGWSLPAAFTALKALSEYRLVYAEQPVSTMSEMKTLRAQLADAHIPVPIAADELVRKASDPLEVARAQAADLLVVKAAPLGGVRRAAAVIEQAGLPAVVSSALESSVGIATGVRLAASLPQLPHGCGLGTVSLMSTDVSATPLTARDGFMTVRSVTLDDARVRQLAAPAPVRERWVGRIRRCYRLLESGYAAAAGR